MPTAVPNGFVEHLRRGMPADPRADGELVREYAATGSEAAFAELVRRFSPLVWGVCRRAVPDRQLAEDSFQATFLVLVRKAGSVRPNAVGGWLHAVAVHTSTRARAMADRRNTRTRPLADHHPAVGVAEPTDADAVRALDEEVSRLPEALRAAVVLCELDGLSRKDAAARLGIAEGTLSSRLASARKRLAARLRGRGVALAVALALVARTADAAPAVSSPTSETASSLADGAVRTMFLSKLKLTAALAVLVATLTAGTLFAAPPASPRERYQIKAPVPKAEKEGVIAVGVTEEQKSRIDLFTPAGEKLTTIPLESHPMYYLSLSRDGKRVAAWAWSEFDPRAKVQSHKGTLLVFDVGTPDTPLVKLEGVPGGGFVFAPDGKTAYLNELAEPDPKKAVRENAIFRFDLQTQKKEALKLPADQKVIDISPDGKTLLTVSNAPKVKGEFAAAGYLVPLATLEPELVTKENAAFNRFSATGTHLLGRRYTDPKNLWVPDVVVRRLKDGETAVVKLEENTGAVMNVAWSPDGKKVLVQRDVLLPEVKQPPPPKGAPPGALFESPRAKPEVAIRNLDGSEPKLVTELKATVHVFGIDWR